jgi:hypothetical protein
VPPPSGTTRCSEFHPFASGTLLRGAEGKGVFGFDGKSRLGAGFKQRLEDAWMRREGIEGVLH